MAAGRRAPAPVWHLKSRVRALFDGKAADFTSEFQISSCNDSTSKRAWLLEPYICFHTISCRFHCLKNMCVCVCIYLNMCVCVYIFYIVIYLICCVSFRISTAVMSRFSAPLEAVLRAFPAGFSRVAIPKKLRSSLQRSSHLYFCSSIQISSPSSIMQTRQPNIWDAVSQSNSQSGGSRPGWSCNAPTRPLGDSFPPARENAAEEGWSRGGGVFWYLSTVLL